MTKRMIGHNEKDDNRDPFTNECEDGSAKPGFRITDGKGFHIHLQNGYIISVQFGFGNYCEEYSKKSFTEEYKKLKNQEDISSKDAEIAIMKDGKFVTRQVLNVDDDVVGYVTPEQLLKLLIKFIAAENL